LTARSAILSSIGMTVNRFRNARVAASTSGSPPDMTSIQVTMLIAQDS
jgi:hypothetical protein